MNVLQQPMQPHRLRHNRTLLTGGQKSVQTRCPHVYTLFLSSTRRQEWRHSMARFLIPLLLYTFLLCFISTIACARPKIPQALTPEHFQQTREALHLQLTAHGITPGSFVFIRIFKLEKTLEVWLQQQNHYTLFNSYPVCSYSGYLGPKLKQGDLQSPEGFYSLSPDQLVKGSAYHLAFDIGYPNLYDRLRQSSGSRIMVHGGCSSTGCFAMGDKAIEEIYLLLLDAFQHGQQVVQVHIFPFALTSEMLHHFSTSPWYDFWQELKPWYRYFEKNRSIPRITVENGKYVASRNHFSHLVQDTGPKYNE